jgi:twitching motility protein PilJ
MALIDQQLAKEEHSSVENLDSDLQNLNLHNVPTDDPSDGLNLIDNLGVPQVDQHAKIQEIDAELNALHDLVPEPIAEIPTLHEQEATLSIELPAELLPELPAEIPSEAVQAPVLQEMLADVPQAIIHEPTTHQELVAPITSYETVEALAAPVIVTPIQEVKDQQEFSKRADQTMIGDVLQRSGDIRLPLIGHLPLQKQIRILLTAMGLSLAFGAVFVYTNASQSKMVSTQVQIAGDILMNSQRIGKAAPNAIQGKPAAFTQLEGSRKSINQDIDILLMGGDYQGRSISKPSSDAAKNLQATKKAWDSSNKASDTILKTQKELNGFRSDLEAMNVLTPDLVSLTDEISTQKVQSKAPPNAIFASGQLIMLTQRLGRSASEFMTAEGINSEKAFLLGKDANTFNDIVEGFINGSEMHDLTATKEPAARENLLKLKKVFDDYRKHVENITDPANLKKFVDAKDAEQLIFNENEDLKKQLGALQNNYSAEQDKSTISFWLLLVSAAFALFSATGIALVLLQDSRNRTKESEQRRQEADKQMQAAQKQEEQANAINERNQSAILRLMNELQDVADGDLTVQATVSEDITGAIADSVNYTVEELRGLVGRVTNTAIQVTNASSQAQTISNDLLEASHMQAQEITDAGKAITSMANDITEVSRSANESADVARQSVSAAEQGSRAVENTIKGMNEIREQIQETSKRIKRLGESSQEIGEITELISDITEQTNVLALNAAIQAASAGEAGRGFSVVAEEVQRLAERSAEATKQIGALVRTIQTDTHDAVAAMEKSTQEVVEGAKLSDAAGAALVNIRDVSNRLAELIQGISLAAEQQATSANGVAQNIDHILSITEKTQNGTQQTSQSIKDLTKLAEELKNSVSRFRVAT